MADGKIWVDTQLDDKGLQSGMDKVGNVAKAGFAVVATAMAGVAVAAVGYNAAMETYQTSFEVMTGSAEEAAAVMDRIKEISAATPFEFKDLAETTQLLMNYGFTAEEAMDRMQMLGDISQGSAEKMNRIATAYGQMSSAGKVSLEDIKQMIEAGFNPLQEISGTTGESMASLYDRISKGTISVDEITASMQRSTSEGGKYFQSMEKQSETLAGQFSTLKDNAMQLTGDLFKPLSDFISNELLPAVNEFIESIDVEDVKAKIEDLKNKFIEMLPEVLGLAAGLVVLKGAMAIQALVDTLTVSVKALTAAIKANPLVFIISLIVGLVVALVTAYNTNEDFRKAVDETFAAIMTVVQPVIDALVIFFTETLPAAFETAKQVFNDIGTAISDFVNGIVTFFTVDIPAAVDQFIMFFTVTIPEAINGFVQGIITFFTTDIPAAFDSFVAFFQGLPETIGYWLGFIIGSVAKWAMDLATNAIKAGQDFFDGLIKFFQGLPGAIWNYINLVITHVIAWAMDLAMKANQAGKDFLDGVIKFFTDLPGNAQQFLSDLISNVTTWASELAQNAMTAGQQFLDNIVKFFTELPGKVGEFLGNTIDNIVTFATDMGSKATEAAQSFFDNIVNGISGLPDRVMQIGSDIVGGIWEGISGAIGWLTSQISGFADAVIKGANDAFKVGSPSKRMRDEVGIYLPMGIWAGFEKKEDWLLGKVSGFSENIMEAATLDVGDLLVGEFDTTALSQARKSLQTDIGVITQNIIGAKMDKAIVEQTINFNQPFETPDMVARAMRLNNTYGLAGA